MNILQAKHQNQCPRIDPDSARDGEADGGGNGSYSAEDREDSSGDLVEYNTGHVGFPLEPGQIRIQARGWPKYGDH